MREVLSGTKQITRLSGEGALAQEKYQQTKSKPRCDHTSGSDMEEILTEFNKKYFLDSTNNF